MKKLILVLCLTFIGLSLAAQEDKKAPYLKSTVKVGTKATLKAKPLVVLKFKNEELDLGFENGESVLSSFPSDAVHSVDVFKTAPSTEKYGERGKNGVVVVTLKNNDDNKALFKKLKAGKPLPTLIKTNVDVGVDSKTSLSLHPSIEVVDGVIKFKGDNSSRYFSTDVQPTVAVSFKGQRVILNESIGTLSMVDMNLAKSIDLIRSTDASPESKNILILVELKENSKAKKFFRKLKRAQKK